MNVPRIKGSHNAILSGILAAEATFETIGAGRAGDVLNGYEDAYKTSAIHHDLYRVRNVKPLLSRLGTVLGTMIGGAVMWLNRSSPRAGTFRMARRLRHQARCGMPADCLSRPMAS
jgi:electron-transferring-flavoprotein dehydrogenase